MTDRFGLGATAGTTGAAAAGAAGKCLDDLDLSLRSTQSELLVVDMLGLNPLSAVYAQNASVNALTARYAAAMGATVAPTQLSFAGAPHYTTAALGDPYLGASLSSLSGYAVSSVIGWIISDIKFSAKYVSARNSLSNCQSLCALLKFSVQF